MQDTYLLATQQEVTLAAELAAHAAVSNSSGASEAVSSSSSNGQDGAASLGHPTGATGLTRRRIFCHRLGTYSSALDMTGVRFRLPRPSALLQDNEQSSL